ncbi:ABC transporter permease [Streptomyces sp. NPDC059862]|uniref:ABC transporter permease n=1 Tax=Streptomyces sp. NPDC059862 TaxID=3346975 RepID=UPI0036665241
MGPSARDRSPPRPRHASRPWSWASAPLPASVSTGCAGQESRQVYIDGHWFTVVGILDPLPLAPDLGTAVLVGWDAARDQLGFDGHPTVVYVTAREPQIEAVRAALPATLHPQLPVLVQVSRPSDALAAKRATHQTLSVLLLGLAGVALLVGGVGVANTMVVSVLERRREIGLRRALGAGRGQIRGQFLAESVALSALGAVPEPFSERWPRRGTPCPSPGPWCSRPSHSSPASRGRSPSAWPRACTPP